MHLEDDRIERHVSSWIKVRIQTHTCMFIPFALSFFLKFEFTLDSVLGACIRRELRVQGLHVILT